MAEQKTQPAKSTSQRQQEPGSHLGSGFSGIYEQYNRAIRRVQAGEVLDDADNQAAFEAAKRMRVWHGIIRSAGQRYSRCRLDDFEQYHDRQIAVLEQLREFQTDLEGHIERGSNLVLFGPCGTGKDHLAMAMLRDAVLGCGVSGGWVSCQELFGRVRDRMDGNDTEASLIDDLTRPEILVISDPVPPFGDLTDFQAAILFRVIDQRYRQRNGTWLTINVVDSDEAKQRIGHAVIDRLVHDSIGLHCNWPSYRAKGYC